MATGQQPGAVVVKAHGVTRSTQSFTYIMAMVWKRPGLVGTEVAWRWAFWLVVAAVFHTWVGDVMGQDWRVYGPLLQHRVVSGDFSTAQALRVIVGVGLFATLVWAPVSALGRTVLLRKLDSGLTPRRGALVALAMMRVTAFSSLLGLWIAVFGWTYVWAIGRPTAAGRDPLYVPGFAVVVVTTLLLFILWTLVSWLFRLSALLAMRRGLSAGAALVAAARSKALSSRLIEVNMVMGIVKVALLVLAMVFSACPLPFSSVETYEFLRNWTVAVIVWYLLASDYFHVVRLASYAALTAADDATVME